jgi:hypothetical protein
MTKDTIIVTNNNVNPVDQIACVSVDTQAEPPTDNITDIDYDTFSQAEKDQHDAYVAMIKSKV